VPTSKQQERGSSLGNNSRFTDSKTLRQPARQATVKIALNRHGSNSHKTSCNYTRVPWCNNGHWLVILATMSLYNNRWILAHTLLPTVHLKNDAFCILQYLPWSVLQCAFSALTLLVWCQKRHTAFKKISDEVLLHGCLSGARNNLQPADDTTTPASLVPLKANMDYHSGASLPLLSF